jgi:hypothetical protein
MSQPLLATYRITQPYTVGGLTHRFRMYVKSDGSFTGGVQNVTKRDGTFSIWTAAASNLMGYIQQATPSPTSPGPSLFEHLVGTLWQPLDTFTIAGPLGSGTFAPASELSVVLRDSAFKQIRVMVLDTNNSALYHSSGYSGGSAGVSNFLAGWNPSTATGADPLFVQVSRGNRYLSTAPLVGVTVAYNRKLRRRRGLT